VSGKRKPSEYGLHGRIQHSVTRVQPGAPSAQIHDVTPIQPIVIQVPREREPSGPKNSHHRGPEWWFVGVVVLIAVILSGSISVYVASQFLDECSSRIEQLDQKIEELDRKIQLHDMTLTRIEAQVEHLNERRNR